ncbi:hypothetical protein RHGRI_002853 [Rhododendron griersonianum]|uniref:Isopenicillin N synthase-like Fe(2+) 2OG dioxygenase domain-containing protein n=1 Tax=Rhododendron griersonianum TaxID=479676 RepID=A0AAV6LRU5_9ERIC|nr:hypothetical protein RHGRI_002853 [Rhododendron griersonianum]
MTNSLSLYRAIFRREVFGPYSVEVRSLGLQILELICEGLGLESGYFRGPLSEGQLDYCQLLSTNVLIQPWYWACPNMVDPHLITLLNQGDVPGLQVWKDEVTVEPIPNAFVIISNGKLKSAYHRVVTSSNVDRTTVAGFILPSKDSLIEPAKSLVSELSPPLYKSFKRGDFDNIYFSDTHEGKDPLEHFRIRS